MKKLKKMSFSDLSTILKLAQTELDYWNGCISNDIHKEDIKIAKEQSKKFFLFNTFRWNNENPNRPDCCDVVPILYQGELTDDCIERVLYKLK